MQDVDALLSLLETHGVPAGRMFRAPDMLEDPHYRARESIVGVAHRTYRNLMMQNVFPRLSATPGAIHWPGPGLGEHNDHVYGELLGIGAEEREALRAEGVI